jgi:3-phenylpropionate/cinnamic acid dioxygenase small subunit
MVQVTEPALTTVAAGDRELQYEFEQFYFAEVELLDEWHWRAWYELFTDDVRYWMPVRKNRVRRERNQPEVPTELEMAHFDEDKTSLELRVRQLESGKHWAEDPPSRTRHLITNVRIRGVEMSGGETRYRVRSNFLCYRNRLETEVDLWAGQREDLLVNTEKGIMIASRTILLDQNVILAKNLSVFF